jgi:hypothetical protein
VTTYVILLAIPQLVSPVLSNVPNVSLLQVIVIFVLVTELMLQFVNAKTDIIILILPTVHLVPLNVVLVKIMLITV